MVTTIALPSWHRVCFAGKKIIDILFLPRSRALSLTLLFSLFLRFTAAILVLRHFAPGSTFAFGLRKECAGLNTLLSIFFLKVSFHLLFFPSLGFLL